MNPKVLNEVGKETSALLDFLVSFELMFGSGSVLRKHYLVVVEFVQ